MTVQPAALIRQVEAAGGHLAATGDRLRVTAPTPLPDALLSELRRHKPEVLRHLATVSPLRLVWDAETTRRADWFLTTEPPSEPFELYPHVHVAMPAGYWEHTKANLRLGVTGPRARWGAIQADLRRLAELFEGPGP